MGLDISVHVGPITAFEVKGERPLGDDGMDQLSDAGGFMVYEDYFKRYAPLEGGKAYVATERTGFCAGPYSSYGRYREALSRAALGVAPEVIWNEKNPTGPFVEQVGFSDCEGIIGFEACKRLAKDYEEHRDEVKPKLPEAKHRELYDKWAAAFQLAVETGGAVEYH